LTCFALEETDLRAQALEGRKAILSEACLAQPIPSRYCDHVIGVR
jgi:hypothetical protein